MQVCLVLLKVGICGRDSLNLTWSGVPCFVFVLSSVPSEMFQQRIHYLMNDDKLSEYLSDCKSWNGKFWVKTFSETFTFLWVKHIVFYVTTMHCIHTYLWGIIKFVCTSDELAMGSCTSGLACHFYQLHPCLNYNILWHLGKKHLFYSLIAYHI